MEKSLFGVSAMRMLNESSLIKSLDRNRFLFLFDYGTQWVISVSSLELCEWRARERKTNE